MFNTIADRLRRERASRRLFEQARIESDPLSHPELRRMSPAELADISLRIGRR